jgi:hypothetical protein
MLVQGFGLSQLFSPRNFPLLPRGEFHCIHWLSQLCAKRTFAHFPNPFVTHSVTQNMAEPVGFAASIITLVELAKDILEYVRDAYHGRKERNEIFLEVTSTLEVLSQLQDKANSAKWGDTMKVLATPHGPLDRLRTNFQSLVRGLKSSDGRLKTAGKALIWPFEKKEYQDILSSLERSKWLLTLALQNDLL